MIKIVSCFWNVESYIDRCINSVKNQTQSEFVMYLIDDVSNDSTVNIIKNHIKNDDRFILIENKNKKFKLKNMDDLIMDNTLIHDDDIIVELDGDDWLYNENVLDFIYQKYEKNKKLWLTNGSFIYSDGRFGFSNKSNPSNVRKEPFLFSHLRTWKAHLWRKIDETSFLDENGEYFKAAPDVAYSFPMIEMAGDLHYEFIPEILLVYNEENPHNEHKDKARAGIQEQIRCANIIRNLKKYDRL